MIGKFVPMMMQSADSLTPLPRTFYVIHDGVDWVPNLFTYVPQIFPEEVGDLNVFDAGKSY